MAATAACSKLATLGAQVGTRVKLSVDAQLPNGNILTRRRVPFAEMAAACEAARGGRGAERSCIVQ